MSHKYGGMLWITSFSVFCVFQTGDLNITCFASDQFILLLGLMTTCFIRTDMSLVLMLRNSSKRLEMQMPKINSWLFDSFLVHEKCNNTHLGKNNWLNSQFKMERMHEKGTVIVTLFTDCLNNLKLQLKFKLHYNLLLNNYVYTVCRSGLLASLWQ